MRIAICDDDERFCHRLKGILEQYEEVRRLYIEIELFFDGIYLCERVASGKRFDLIFLDILMQKSDGVETGRFIRRILDDYDTRIIYVSSDRKQALELFQNRPMDFWRKPVTEERVYQALDDIQKLNQKRCRFFSYKREKVEYQVPYSEILYFQSAGRKVQIHTPDEIHQFTGKLSQLLNQGLPPNFISIHKSYVVNKDYIAIRTYDHVYIREEDLWLSVSQIHRKPVREILDKSSVEKWKDREEPGTNFDRETDEF